MNYQGIKKLFVVNKAYKKLIGTVKLSDLYILYAVNYTKGITSSGLYKMFVKLGKTRRKGEIYSALVQLCAEGFIHREKFKYQKGYIYSIEAKGISALQEFEKELRIIRIDRI